MASEHFGGGAPRFRHLVRPVAGLSGEIWHLLQRVEGAFTSIEDKVTSFHLPIVTATAQANAPGQQPDVLIDNALITLGFTVGTDRAYRQFKIPNNFVGNPAFHIHWTKSGDVDEQGKAAKWRVSYVVFPGDDGLGSASPTVAEVEDVYEASDTTDRRVYRTANIPMVGFVARYYVSMCVEAIAPTGAALATEPALYSLDMTFDQYINKS